MFDEWSLVVIRVGLDQFRLCTCFTILFVLLFMSILTSSVCVWDKNISSSSSSVQCPWIASVKLGTIIFVICWRVDSLYSLILSPNKELFANKWKQFLLRFFLSSLSSYNIVKVYKPHVLTLTTLLRTSIFFSLDTFNLSIFHLWVKEKRERKLLIIEQIVILFWPKVYFYFVFITFLLLNCHYFHLH